jgi:mono/diheme cytochrome c family protein
MALAETPPEDFALYRHWCARCHGENGDGKGLAAPALALNGAPPRDFTTGIFKFKSTRSGEAPTDDDVRRVIAEGLPGTSMPYFRDLLSKEEIGRLVAVVRSFARDPLPLGSGIDLGPPLADGEDVRRRGRAAYEALQCAACHGERGMGDGASAPALRNHDGTRARPADLTRPWTFRGGAQPADIVMRMATGIAGTAMPGYLDAATTGDLWALAHYIVSLARAPSLRQAAIDLAKKPPGEDHAMPERGEYLVKSGTCFLCHVQMRTTGAYDEKSFGAGGMKVRISYIGTVFTRNLTPDPETGIGGWTPEDLRRAFRTGRSRNGRPLSALDMPWTILADLDDRDIDAVHAYLASLPPVRNLVPRPRSASWSDALSGKLRMLVAGEQIKAGYFPTNYGTSPDTKASPEVPNPRGHVAIILMLGVVLALYLSLSRRPLGVVAVLGGGFAVLVIYTWPPLPFMPSSLVRAKPPYETLARLLNMPPLRPPPEPVDISDPGLQALARRGRYVATIGTCSLCHTAGPSVTRLYAPFPEMGGGMRVNWKVFGTTYSQNLTPDPETGLGHWSEAEIRRAITSGIARDGRLMHWQAMPWDHFSNLSPEDLDALVFYLQHLPAAHSKVPGPQAPRPGDEEADTFYFGYTGEYRPE